MPAVAMMEKPARSNSRGDVDGLLLVAVVHGDEHGARKRQHRLRGLLGLEERLAEVAGQAQDLAGRAHLGAEDGIDLREHVEREDGFLDAVVREGLLAQFGHGAGTPRDIAR